MLGVFGRIIQSPLNAIQQLLGIGGLLQKIEGAGLHRLDRDGDVAIGGNHDDGKGRLHFV